MDKKIQDIRINSDQSLFQALNLMDQQNKKLLIVLDSDGNYLSLLSIGDIQRALLQNKSLNESVDQVLRKNITVGRVDDNLNDLKDFVLKNRIEFMPILNDSNEIQDVIFWEDLTSGKRAETNLLSNLPVVIMAGGKGTRLRPITHVIPKPMVPIGEKSILQIIIENFKSFGCKDYSISVNYKAEMIEQHISDLNLDQTNVSFFREDTPLGTAGSLSLIKDQLKGTFIVTNCDIVIDQDFSEVYEYHKNAGNKLTALAAMKRFSIPYGIMEVEANGQLTDLKEKPSFDYRVNAGVYFIEADVLHLIPENKLYNITDLMEELIRQKENIGVFPVSEGSWLDIGEWKEYQKTQEIFKARGI